MNRVYFGFVTAKILDVIVDPFECGELVFQSQIECPAITSCVRAESVSAHGRKFAQLLTFLAKPIVEVRIYKRRALRAH